MNMTDPIADMLTRVRNAAQARHSSVEIPFSKIKLAIAKIMEQEGYIGGFDMQDRERPAKVLQTPAQVRCRAQARRVTACGGSAVPGCGCTRACTTSPAFSVGSGPLWCRRTAAS